VVLEARDIVRKDSGRWLDLDVLRRMKTLRREVSAELDLCHSMSVGISISMSITWDISLGMTVPRTAGSSRIATVVKISCRMSQRR
jgi:hypothetical protein